MTLRNEDFVQCFAQHIIPHRLVRIRHHGIFSSSWKSGKLQALQLSVHASRPAAIIKTMLRKCPCCKTGTLVTIDVFGKRGPPQKYFTGQQCVPIAKCTGKVISVTNLKLNRCNLLFIAAAATLQKKQAFSLPANPKTKTGNSITSRLPRFRSTALSFLARWAK